MLSGRLRETVHFIVVLGQMLFIKTSAIRSFTIGHVFILSGVWTTMIGSALLKRIIPEPVGISGNQERGCTAQCAIRLRQSARCRLTRLAWQEVSSVGAHPDYVTI